MSLKYQAFYTILEFIYEDKQDFFFFFFRKFRVRKFFAFEKLNTIVHSCRGFVCQRLQYVTTQLINVPK